MAVICVALTQVAVNEVEPHKTVEAAVKLVPLMVSVYPAPPTTTIEGLRLVMVGADGLTVKVAAGETPPVVVTVTLGEPTVPIKLGGMATVNCVTLT